MATRSGLDRSHAAAAEGRTRLARSSHTSDQSRCVHLEPLRGLGFPRLTARYSIGRQLYLVHHPLRSPGNHHGSTGTMSY